MKSGDSSPETKSGCGLLAALFTRKPKQSPPQNAPSSSTPKPTPISPTLPLSRSPPAPTVPPQNPTTVPRQNPTIPPQNPTIPRQNPTIPRQNPTQQRRSPSPITISGELDTLINEHHRPNPNSNLVRASSSNVMLVGTLGNIRGSHVDAPIHHRPLPRPHEEKAPPKPLDQKRTKDETGPFCRALSTRMDPEKLKMMGNEDYKNGNYAEALALYEAAIALDPKKASYRSNKSAALTALGRLLEAVFECREAIRIEPNYHRAHHRLACLYIRLGDAETAVYHFKHAGPEADHVDVSKGKELQSVLCKCSDAKRIRDWNSVLKETFAAISAGADSAPHIYSLQAEAHMRLRRHDAAEEALGKCPKFDEEAGTRFFGPIAFAGLLVVRAQVEMATGRFEEAVAVAERAAKLDPSSREAVSILRKTKAVANARTKGNQLFKAGRFEDAIETYGEGLEHDSHNAVLLCNRAACRCKLGHLGKAADDCSAALMVRPSYSKAKLRRADCYFKMGNWEASMKDYESLLALSPDDEEMIRVLEEVKKRMKL